MVSHISSFPWPTFFVEALCFMTDGMDLIMLDPATDLRHTWPKLEKVPRRLGFLRGKSWCGKRKVGTSKICCIYVSHMFVLYIISIYIYIFNIHTYIYICCVYIYREREGDVIYVLKVWIDYVLPESFWMF